MSYEAPLVLVRFDGCDVADHQHHGFMVMPNHEWMYYAARVSERLMEVQTRLGRVPEMQITGGPIWLLGDWEKSFEVTPITPDEAQVLYLLFDMPKDRPVYGYFPSVENMVESIRS